MRLQNKSSGKIVEHDFSRIYSNIILSDGTPVFCGYYTWEANDDYLYDDIALFYPEWAWKELPNE